MHADISAYYVGRSRASRRDVPTKCMECETSRHVEKEADRGDERKI